MRDQDPQSTNQSRIRFHEEPEAKRPTVAGKRVRKPTVIGMPAFDGPASENSPSASAAPGAGASNPTMLGIPRLEPRADAPSDAVTDDLDPTPSTDRGRAFVRYDSLLEPPAVVIRRKRALRGVAVLVVLATAWLIYRFLNA